MRGTATGGRRGPTRAARAGGIGLAMLGASACAWGCGGAVPGPVIVPVSGKVTVDGKPAAKARISFQPLGAADPSAPPTIAISEEDGTFRPTTIDAHDGMPAGEYAVGVAWPAIKEDRGEEIEGADRLKGRYASPASSGLRAVVKAGGGELPPFELSTTRKVTGSNREGHAR